MSLDPSSEPVALAPAAPLASPLVRAVLWLCGSLALVLAVAGVFLPLLPTTPFVLVAASCYARASPRFHGWLLHNRMFGPLIHDWQRHRSIPMRVKWIAIGSMAVSASVSVYLLAGRPWLQLALVATVMGAGLWLSRIPTRSPDRS